MDPIKHYGWKLKILSFFFSFIFLSDTSAQTLQWIHNPADTASWVRGSSRNDHRRHKYVDDTIVMNIATFGANNYMYNTTPVTLSGASSSFHASFDFRIDSNISCSDGLTFWFFTSSLYRLGSTTKEGGAMGFPDTVSGFALALKTITCTNRIYMKKINSTSYSWGGGSGADTNICTPTLTQAFLTDGNWHNVDITYNMGNITTIFDGGLLTLSGFSLLSGTGHFGFMATNGAGFSRKCLKNVQINYDITLGLCVGADSTLHYLPAGGAWSSSNTSVATVSSVGKVVAISPGLANITYTTGCTTPIITIVTVSAVPASITGSTTLCVGATTTLANSVSGGSWSSSNSGIASVGSSSGIVTGGAVGIANITYAVSQCYATATVSVGLSSTPITGTMTFCSGSTVTLANASGGGSWSSSNTAVANIGSLSGIITGLSAGTALISYSLGSCSNTTAIVTVNAIPVAISGGLGLCSGTSATLTNTVTGGVWTSGNTTVATISATGIVSGLAAGTSIITYAIGSCSVTATVTVSTLAPGITGAMNFCSGSTITLANGSGGGTWSSSNTTVADIGSLSGIVTGLSPGTAVITYSLGTCGSATAIVTVIVPPNAGAVNGPTTLCAGSTITLTNTVTGGTWSRSNSSIAFIGTSTGIVTGLLAGVDTVTYTVTNAGCSANVIWVITVNPLPGIGGITGNLSVCKGAVITLANSVAGGTWSNSNVATATIGSSSGIVSAVNIGTTVITYRIGPSPGGCFRDTTVIFEVVLPAIKLNKTIIDIKCFGSSDGSIAVAASAATPCAYLWSNGSTMQSIANLGLGTYWLTTTETAKQCSRTDTFTITQPDSLTINEETINDTCKMANGSIQVTVSGGRSPYRYEWSNNQKTAFADKLADGIYTLTLTDANGCVKVSSYTVGEEKCGDIKIYEAVSPNNDGLNDTWIITGLRKYPDNLVQLYDKWGDLVYAKKAYNNEWYGQATDGKLLPDGTYYYMVKLNAPNMTGGKEVFTGSLLLKR